MSDLSQPSPQVVLDLVGANNTVPYPLSTDNITIGRPSASTTSKDTDLVLTGVTRKGYTGSVIVHYNRVDLADIPNLPNATLSWTTQVSSSDLIDQINTIAGISLLSVDIVVESLPSKPGDNSTTSYTLQAATSSPAYKGSTTIQLQPA